MVRSTGLYRESSYSSSLLGFCLIFFFVSLSPGCCSYHEHELRRKRHDAIRIDVTEPTTTSEQSPSGTLRARSSKRTETTPYASRITRQLHSPG